MAAARAARAPPASPPITVNLQVDGTTLATAPLVYFNRNRRSLEATWKYLLIGSLERVDTVLERDDKVDAADVVVAVSGVVVLMALISRPL